MLYVVGRSPALTAQVVTTLQHLPSTGVIFTRTGLAGTFPLAEAGLAAPTAPDIVVASAWKITPGPDAHTHVEVSNDGYSEYSAGGGMHVTLSPTDLHNLAVASGPDFRRGAVDSLPSGNIDIAPTLLWLMGVKPGQPLDGRVLHEALLAGDQPFNGAKPGRIDARAELSDGVWEQHITFSELGAVRYLEEGNGRWQPLAVARHGPSSDRPVKEN